MTLPPEGPLQSVFGRFSSVRGNLTLVIMLTTAAALLTTGIALLRHDLTVYRQALEVDLTTEADILALSTAPAIAFEDQKGATRALSALSAKPAVRVAALYSPSGDLYAAYVRSATTQPPGQLPVAGGEASVSGGKMHVARMIRQNGEFLGTIYLIADYDVWGHVDAYLRILGMIMLMSLAVALALSAALRRSITGPVEALASVANDIVTRRDPTLRAPDTPLEEFSLVVKAFNSVLDESQERTQALQQSNQALTQEIQERMTAESALALANTRLEENISRIKKTEEALREADRRKDEFLATLAHELRNPLAPIRHAARLLGVKGIDESQGKSAREIITRQVTRMALLLDDLLELSRITRGRVELRREPVAISALVSAALETAQPLIDSKHHTLSMTLPAEDTVVVVDPLRMSQALSNLLTNATKYTDPGGRITLDIQCSAQGVRFAVTDSGIGIQANLLPAIFEMFSQVDSAIDRSEGGLGIGLALVKGLVSLHGGWVEAASEGPGKGSTFTIRLPGELIRANAAVRVAVPTMHSADDPRGRILVVDDNRDAANSLAMVLSSCAHTTFTAYSGEQALQVGDVERPEVVVLDIGMPDMTGYEAAQRIRQTDWGKNALLLAVTGWGQKEDIQRAASAGFNFHMTKPADPERVEHLVKDFLTHKAQHG
ncbi:MAG: ATP-binding protein [Pseudomonadota bacterium]